MEIDLAAEDPDHLFGESVWNIGRVGGGEQGVADLARFDGGLHSKFNHFFMGDKIPAAALDEQSAVSAADQEMQCLTIRHPEGWPRYRRTASVPCG